MATPFLATNRLGKQFNFPPRRSATCSLRVNVRQIDGYSTFPAIFRALGDPHGLLGDEVVLNILASVFSATLHFKKSADL